MESNAFKNKLEQFRLHYKNTYGIEMDDETLYFFIRVNEMQIAITKRIDDIARMRPHNRSEYFFYGLGIATKWLIIISAASFLIFLILRII
ncbi:MAG TPA: hypothetical protein DCQ50_01625 [Chryseobacterium sp.]|nr:hypothetical protein [Chryseobacterium sp.]